MSSLIALLGWPRRLVKNAFTSGWPNRYAEVAAETPDETPARSAAVQLGGGSATADGAAPKSIAPAVAPAPIAPATARRAARPESSMVQLLHRVLKGRNQWRLSA